MRATWRRGWVSLYLAEKASLLLPEPATVELSEGGVAVREALEGRGAMFFRQVVDAVGSLSDTEVLLSLWELVWAGAGSEMHMLGISPIDLARVTQAEIVDIVET